MFRLLNSGSSALEYEVDLSSLEELRKENNDFDVFLCRKSRGIIPPKGVDFIEWIFRPIVAKAYKVDIPITVKDGKTTLVTFNGSGYETPLRPVSKADPKSFPDSIPVRQIIQSCFQQATLSFDRINFGHAPLGSILRRIVVIQNIDENSDIIFKWRIPSFWGSDGKLFFI